MDAKPLTDEGPRPLGPTTAERYPDGWVWVSLMVSPDGSQFHSMGGERDPGEGDRPYIGLARILATIDARDARIAELEAEVKVTSLHLDFADAFVSEFDDERMDAYNNHRTVKEEPMTRLEEIERLVEQGTPAPMDYRWLIEAVKLAKAALDDEGDLCGRCEGNGSVYADGQAHYYSEHAPTKACPDCGGTGMVCSGEAEDAFRKHLEGK